MRVTSAKRILYASGSGVYGDFGTKEIPEDQGALLPISTYGASKLAGEALIASYSFMFGLSRLRVPLRQRGRPAADARRRLRLRAAPAGVATTRRRAAASWATAAEQVLRPHHRHHRAPCCARTQHTETASGLQRGHWRHITVREIAELAVECVGLAPAAVRFDYTGGDRGWKGDVPVVRLDTRRASARSAGHQMNSSRGAAPRRRHAPRHENGADVSARRSPAAVDPGRPIPRSAAAAANDVAEPELSIVIPALNEELTMPTSCAGATRA